MDRVPRAGDNESRDPNPGFSVHSSGAIKLHIKAATVFPPPDSQAYMRFSGVKIASKAIFRALKWQIMHQDIDSAEKPLFRRVSAKSTFLNSFIINQLLLGQIALSGVFQRNPRYCSLTPGPLVWTERVRGRLLNEREAGAMRL